jgi:hypothetical protein
VRIPVKNDTQSGESERPLAIPLGTPLQRRDQLEASDESIIPMSEKTQTNPTHL